VFAQIVDLIGCDERVVSGRFYTTCMNFAHYSYVQRDVHNRLYYSYVQKRMSDFCLYSNRFLPFLSISALSSYVP